MFLVGLTLFLIARSHEKHLKQVDSLTEKYNIELNNENLKLVQENQHLIKKRDEIQEENKTLDIEQDKIKANIFSKQEQLEQIIKNIKITTESSENMSRKAFESYCDVLDLEYKNKEEQWNEDLERLNQIFFQRQQDLNRDLEQQKETIEKELEERRGAALREKDQIEADLAKIKSTRAAAMEAQLREQEIKEKLSFYCLQVKPADLEDIKILERVRQNLHTPRIMAMLIWKTFFQAAANTLCANVIGSTVKTGIYKITNQVSGLCYIGQAVNLRERWLQHIKAGLSIDTPAGNKLYQAMIQDGVWNFSFEVLEECKPEELNDKERYYIELYDSKNYGYNTTKGNSK